MKTRTIGKNGPQVSALGLGLMGMSDFYGPADEKESIATVEAALDAGITLFDTGDFYGMGHNELLLGQALAGKRERAFIQVKFGAQRGPDGSWLGYDARPAAVKTALAYTLRRLRTDYVDIYRPARLDPQVPIEETVGAIGEMVKAGHVRHVGLSEVGADTLRRAAATHPVADLQIEYSLISRGIEDEILRSRTALLGREPRTQPPAHRCAARHCRVQAGRRGAGGDRMGARARRGHRAAGRRPHARTPGRVARRARARALTGRPRRNRTRGAAGRRRG